MNEEKTKPLLLIVDDIHTNLQILGTILSGHYQISATTSGRQALKILGDIRPDLILLDIMMPDMNGLEVCTKLKESPETKEIPIIFLTAKTEPNDVAIGFKTGAVDYVTKPFNGIELMARIETHLELRDSQKKLKQAYRKLQRAHEELLVNNQKLLQVQTQLEQAAKTDYLTGLANRRAMLEKLRKEKKDYEKEEKIFSTILCDIDDFKVFNDCYGHDCGDFILEEMSKKICQSVRDQDVVARWGGEEFLIFLPDCNLENAKIIAQRIRREIEKNSFLFRNHKLRLTMTFGISIYKHPMKIDDCIREADMAMYKGKDRGKNCVEIYTEKTF